MRTRTLTNGRSVKVRDNGGLKKRCRCPRRQWSKCAHPWHFGFANNGKEYRWSLHKVAEKPPGYWMSKTEAQAIADRLRSDIRAGSLTGTGTTSPDTGLTFGDVVERYLERHVRVPTRRPAAQQIMEWHLGVLRRAEVPAAGGATIRLEHKPLTAISKADVEAVRDGRRAQAKGAESTERVRPGCKGGEVGINRLLARLRHVFSFAVTSTGRCNMSQGWRSHGAQSSPALDGGAQDGTVAPVATRRITECHWSRPWADRSWRAV